MIAGPLPSSNGHNNRADLVLLLSAVKNGYRVPPETKQNATAWLRRNFELMGLLPPRRELTPLATGGRIEVVWCSRGVHPRAGGEQRRGQAAWRPA